MVDMGISVNVMYRACFDQIRSGLKQLGLSSEPLYGFTGDTMVPVRRISLPFTIGDIDRQPTTLAEFLIVNCLAYNIVLGRPAMNDLDLVTSIRSLTIKFLTSNGVGCVRGEQHLARRCYEDAIKMGAKGNKVNIVIGSDPRPPSQKRVSYDLDPCEVDCDRATGPVEELKDISVSEMDEEICLKPGRNLAPEDMVGIGIAPEVVSHKLNVDHSYKPMHQKRRAMTFEHYAALKEKVDKLLTSKFIREAHYPTWDSFPLPRIDQLVDATAGHQLLSFMDAHLGYNQIPMNPDDDEHTSFITDRGIYCYKMMPFGLKNDGATYQRLVTHDV
ncbi:uncharacterized protein LOC127798287 [Diospyros lotus]|uniref:uncharacterized protein LOC127798287 n=1 Tax=Diospyros lotus TaxID=55363 RepID=UPI00224CD1A4|nr:uncharacterized protein LOC127798287 [Diospyros lotus]